MIDSADSVASAFYSYCVQVEENIEAAIVSKIHEIGGNTYEEITLDKNKTIEALQMYAEKDNYIKLPCKVGEKIFYLKVDHQSSYISSGVVEAFIINDSGLYIHVTDKDGNSDITNQFISTEADAENALKGIKT